jgi:hypothetical protein
MVSDLDNLFADEFCAASRSIFRVLDAIFPLENSPSWVITLGEFAEDRTEVHLSVAKRAEASGTFRPTLVASVRSASAIRAELGILRMECADERMVYVDELEIVEMLQHEVARVIKNASTRVLPGSFKEVLKRHPVVEIFTRVEFEANIDPSVIEGIQNW